DERDVDVAPAVAQGLDGVVGALRLHHVGVREPLLQHGGDPLAHERVVVDDQKLHPSPFPCSIGSLAVILVPRPGAESTSRVPPASATRRPIISSPKCLPSLSVRGRPVLKPRPVSATSTASSSSEELTHTVTLRASACFA